MSFPLSPAMPFSAAAGVVPSWWLNEVRASLPRAVDGIYGGEYSLLPAHTLDFPSGGGDIDVGAPIHIRDGDVPAAGVLDVLTGANINIYGTETVKSGGELDIAANGKVVLKATSGVGALSYVNTQGVLFAQTGTLIGLFGSVVLSDYSTGGTSGTLYVGHDPTSGTGGAGHIIVDGSGAGNGSNILVRDGADITLDGISTILNVQNGAELSVGGVLSKVYVGTSARVTFNDTTTFRAEGANYFGDGSGSGSATQYQSWEKSGDKAVTFLRERDLPTGSATFKASEADVWRVPTGLSVGHAWTPEDEDTTFEYVVIAKNPPTQGFNCTLTLDAAVVAGAVMVTFLSAGGGLPACVRVLNRGAIQMHLVESFFDGTTTGNAASATI